MAERLNTALHTLHTTGALSSRELKRLVNDPAIHEWLDRIDPPDTRPRPPPPPPSARTVRLPPLKPGFNEHIFALMHTLAEDWRNVCDTLNNKGTPVPVRLQDAFDALHVAINYKDNNINAHLAAYIEARHHYTPSIPVRLWRTLNAVDINSPSPDPSDTHLFHFTNKGKILVGDMIKPGFMAARTAARITGKRVKTVDVHGTQFTRAETSNGFTIRRHKRHDELPSNPHADALTRDALTLSGAMDACVAHLRERVAHIIPGPRKSKIPTGLRYGPVTPEDFDSSDESESDTPTPSYTTPSPTTASPPSASSNPEEAAARLTANMMSHRIKKEPPTHSLYTSIGTIVKALADLKQNPAYIIDVVTNFIGRVVSTLKMAYLCVFYASLVIACLGVTADFNFQRAQDAILLTDHGNIQSMRLANPTMQLVATAVAAIDPFPNGKAKFNPSFRGGYPGAAVAITRIGAVALGTFHKTDTLDTLCSLGFFGNSTIANVKMAARVMAYFDPIPTKNDINLIPLSSKDVQSIYQPDNYHMYSPAVIDAPSTTPQAPLPSKNTSDAPSTTPQVALPSKNTSDAPSPFTTTSPAPLPLQNTSDAGTDDPQNDNAKAFDARMRAGIRNIPDYNATYARGDELAQILTLEHHFTETSPQDFYQDPRFTKVLGTDTDYYKDRLSPQMHLNLIKHLTQKLTKMFMVENLKDDFNIVDRLKAKTTITRDEHLYYVRVLAGSVIRNEADEIAWEKKDEEVRQRKLEIWRKRRAEVQYVEAKKRQDGVVVIMRLGLSFSKVVVVASKITYDILGNVLTAYTPSSSSLEALEHATELLRIGE